MRQHIQPAAAVLLQRRAARHGKAQHRRAQRRGQQPFGQQGGPALSRRRGLGEGCAAPGAPPHLPGAGGGKAPAGVGGAGTWLCRGGAGERELPLGAQLWQRGSLPG